MGYHTNKFQLKAQVEQGLLLGPTTLLRQMYSKELSPVAFQPFLPTLTPFWLGSQT